MNAETLIAKMARLQAENTKLRRVAKQSGDAARLERITTDAKQLLVWRFSGFSISQRAVSGYGMTRRAWQWARGLLMLAGIHNGHDLTCSDFNEALAAFNGAVARLEREGLEPLKFSLPQHCTLENRYKRQEKLASKTACNTAGNTARQGMNNNASFSNAPSTNNRAVGEGLRSGIGRDRRREIEERQRVKI